MSEDAMNREDWIYTREAINRARCALGLRAMNDIEIDMACLKDKQVLVDINTIINKDLFIERKNGPDLTLRNGTNPVDHPSHYGGVDNIYEAIKVIDAWEVGFSVGNALKYICRAGKKNSLIEDLEKAAWYLNHEVELLREKAKK